jgi:hypothetical protein
MFTAENTEGFSDSDLVTNNWRGDGADTVASLAAVRTPHLRIPGQ